MPKKANTTSRRRRNDMRKRNRQRKVGHKARRGVAANAV